MRLRIVSLIDWLFFILFPLASLALATYSSLTPQEPQARLVAWLSAVGWIGISVAVLIRHYHTKSLLKYESTHRMWVGWTKSPYAVRLEDFDAEVEELLDRLEPVYPLARQALAGCTVVFREATWVQFGTLRRVAGEQDGTFIVVGWHPRVQDGALQHELAHRILQVCAGDPPEDKAHEVLVKLGIL